MDSPCSAQYLKIDICVICIALSYNKASAPQADIILRPDSAYYNKASPILQRHLLQQGTPVNPTASPGSIGRPNATLLLQRTRSSSAQRDIIRRRDAIYYNNAPVSTTTSLSTDAAYNNPRPSQQSPHAPSSKLTLLTPDATLLLQRTRALAPP